MRGLSYAARLGHKGAANPHNGLQPRHADQAPFRFLAALMLGGCQTITALGDHAAATVGLEDSAPKAYTSRSSSNPPAAALR